MDIYAVDLSYYESVKIKIVYEEEQSGSAIRCNYSAKQPPTVTVLQYISNISSWALPIVKQLNYI